MGFAAALTAASPYLMAGGIGMQAGSQLYGGRFEEAEAKRNAEIAEMNAKAALEKSQFDQLRQLREGRRIMGAMAAKQGASGARLDVGAPLMARFDQAAELALENRMIGYEGQVEAWKYRTQAADYRREAKYARRRGYAKATGSLLQGFASLSQLMLPGAGKEIVKFGSSRLGATGVTGPHIP